MNIDTNLIYHLASGQILRRITAIQTVADANLQDGEALIKQSVEADLNAPLADTHYIAEGAVVARPNMPDLPTQGIASMTVDLGSFPPNWLCTIINEDGDAYVWTPDMGTTLTLEDPGSYEITVTAPFPYRPIINHVITVSAAAEVGIDVSANTVVGGESIV